jgi:FkbM family methyltransferase
MNQELNTRLQNELRRGGIVSNRLKYVIDKCDLSNVNEILDIGSWHLEQSLELNRLFPNSNVTAFEPVPESYQQCVNKRNLLTEDIKSKISVFNLAISDFNGKSPFYPVDLLTSSHPNIGASSLLKFKEGLNGSFFNETWNQKEIIVDCLTLDNWCDINSKKNIDVIWIDVQGAELNVFKGAEKTLKNTKVIFTEVGLKPYYEGHSMRDDIDNFLINLGFIEIKESFELNGFDYEANTIYIKK